MVRVSSLIIGIILLILGAAGGATAYRFGPHANLENKLATAVSNLSQTQSRLTDTLRELNGTREELKNSQAKLRQSLKRLGITESQLGFERTKRTEAEQENRRTREELLLKERDVYVLRTCLDGVRSSYAYYLKYDSDSALASLQSVNRECQAAWSLLR